MFARKRRSESRMEGFNGRLQLMSPLGSKNSPVAVEASGTSFEGSRMPCIKESNPQSINRCSRIALAFVVALIFMSVPGLGSAATYYVDPASGSDGNNGTSPSTPWLNPPGTRTANSSGFSSTTWGGISTSNKIKCGDLILLKGGSTHTNAKGGAWWITPSYYTSTCTSGSRITIRIATASEWSGSNGHFTINGSGMTASCDPNYLPTDRAKALVALGGMNFVELKGVSDTQRITIINSNSYSVSAGCSGTNCSGSSVGLRGDWWDMHDSNGGVSLGRLNNWQISNSIAYMNDNICYYTGWNNDHIVDQGGFVNVVAHDSGCGSAANPACTSGGGSADQFFLVGGRGLWCVNCTSYNAGERGVNTGVIQDANMGGDFVYRFRNLTSYNNGASCAGGGPHYCSSAGIDTSGNDGANSDRSRNYIVGGIFWRNKSLAESTYGFGYQEAWHITAYYNATDGGGASHALRSDANNQLLFNSIDSRQGGGGASYSAGSSGTGSPEKTFTPTALNNCYRPSSSNSESLGASYGGWPGSGSYASPPSWIGPTNKVGLTNCDPKFAALSTSSFASNNFTLQAGSTAIDAGRFLMLANGAGNNSTTIAVKSNGGSGDPRNYFISPASYLDATPDIIQIQNATCAAGAPSLPAGRAKIVSMTATAITLDRACSWTNGAGVHLPWAGSAPDMGALESGFSNPGSPAAPTLLSVEPLP
jgi:hypothetical protein